MTVIRPRSRAAFIGALGSFLALVALGQGLTMNTVAGNGGQGYFGDNGPATSAELWALAGLAVDAAGDVFIADTGNSRIRKVTPDGTITTIAGDGVPNFSGDGGPAINAELNFPRAVAVDGSGNLYIADTGNARIRKISTAGIITTIAGDGNNNFSGDGGPAALSEIALPWQLAIDAAGNLFIVDRTDQRIRKIALDGTISTVAGNGQQADSGDGGPAVAAALFVPDAVAVDAQGNLYITEGNGASLRKVTTNGIINTIVGGNGNFGFSGDGGPAASAQLNDPQGVAVDPAGNIYISDEDNQRIRLVTTDGKITTVAGNGTATFSGDGGPAASSTLNLPEGIASGPNGIYFVDSGNKRVRVLTAPPSISSGGIVSASDYGQFRSVAPGSWIEIYGYNLATGTRIWSGSDFNGALAPTKLNGTSVTIGGMPTFTYYVSSGQLAVQVPSNAPLGQQAVVVTTGAGASAPQTVNVVSAQPGLLAPAVLNLGGIHYLGAVFSDGVTYVLPPGAVPGLNSQRAKPGDTITIYGIGFGPVTPNIPAGQVVQQSNTLTAPFQMNIGGVNAALAYWGLAPGEIGLYQFNVVVPQVAANDATPVTFTLGGVPGTQTVAIAVGN